MPGKQIDRMHARQIRDSLYPAGNYLIRLRERMDKVGFASSDPLYRLVMRAQEIMQALSMELHYRSWEGGVGRATEILSD